VSFGASELTRDGFLGGRLSLWQPRRGYRAGIDPVLLAAAVPASPGERVLELGLGAAVASLCLGARVPGLALAGLEVQPAYAGLARRNAAESGLTLEVVEGDLRRMPAVLRVPFDRVLMNPPYFPAAGRVAAPDAGREAGRGEAATLAEWLAAGLRRVRPGGTLTVIQPAARLPDLLAGLPRGGVVVQPVAPREGRDATLVLVTATRGARSPFALRASLVLHVGADHAEDGGGFAPWAEDVLRKGAALPAASPGGRSVHG
jgi:tRNA1Val (adenine37-N6)-methyltransferase